VTFRPTLLAAALVLLAVAAPARAQSLDNGAAAPVAPIPSEAQHEGAAPPVPMLLPLPAASTAAVAPARQAADTAPRKPARVPLAKRWWFWAGLGAAAVGVVLGAIFLGPRDPYNGNASPGTVEIF
jgi:hypothetical protein